MTDLTLWGEGEHVGLDLPNSNRGVFVGVRGRRLGTFVKVRTVGETGQVEHNTFERCEWSQCGNGLMFDVGADATSGGQKGQRIWNCTGHETMVNVAYSQDTNAYTLDVRATHFWFNRNLPWSIGFYFDGHMAGAHVDASMEVAWPDRDETWVVPVVAGPNSSRWDQFRGRLHLTNKTDTSAFRVPLVSQHDQSSSEVAAFFDAWDLTATP